MNNCLTTTVYRLELAKKSNTISEFASRIFTSLFKVADIYRTTITGSSSKRKDSPIECKKPLNKIVKPELYKAAIIHVNHLTVDTDFQSKINQSIVSKFKNNEEYTEELRKKLQYHSR